jgi:Protein of unknown function (DUF2795)
MSDENQEYQKNVSEQSGIEGQRKEVNVENYPEAVSLAQLIKDVDFPTDKNKLIEHARRKSGGSGDDEKAIKKLQSIEDKRYENVAEVTRAAGLVH